MSKSRKSEWFADEHFWRDTYPFMFPRERMEAAVEKSKQLLKLTKPKGKRVLDLCCGPGRFAINLARRKYTVTGVDRTKFLLNKAKVNARNAGVKVEWILQDMRDFLQPDSFDLALSMFTSFGYFEDKREDILVLKNIYANLHANGVCVIDVMGKERLARIFDPAVSSRLDDGSTLIQLHEVADDWTRINNEWIHIKGGKTKSYRFNFRVYSGQELRDQLEQVGFTRVRLYGNLDGSPYDRDAQRLIAVATKSGRIAPS